MTNKWKCEVSKSMLHQEGMSLDYLMNMYVLILNCCSIKKHQVPTNIKEAILNFNRKYKNSIDCNTLLPAIKNQIGV